MAIPIIAGAIAGAAATGAVGTEAYNSLKDKVNDVIINSYEDEASQYIIGDDKFSTPEMGDYYLGAVDTEYLSYLDSLLSDTENPDAKNAAYYTDPPAMKECGYSKEKSAYFLKAEVANNWNTVDGGWITGDELLIKISSLSVDGNNTAEAKEALDKFKKSLMAKTGKAEFDSLNEEDYFTLSLYGITSAKPPKWAYESNVPKGTFKFVKDNIIREYERENKKEEKEKYNSYINDISHIVFPIHDTGEIINDTKSIGNVSREVNFTSGDADSDTSSFRWCIYRGEYDYEAARKAAKKMSEILNKVNNTVYILVDDSNSNKAYSYMEKQGLLCGENARKLYSISNPKHGALNGYCLARMELMGKRLGSAYIKVDGKWCNLAKVVQAELNDKDAVDYCPFETKSDAFKSDYDKDAAEWADAFRAFNDRIDDRKEIQQKIFGKEWSDLHEWTVTIGDTTLLIPPTSINIISHNETESTPLLRANGSMHKSGKLLTRQINLDIYFYGENGVNGYKYDTKTPNGKKITYYMNGLRALIAQFKFTPFLPIENDYINNTAGIDAVVFSGINIESIPNFPSLYHAVVSLTEFDYTVYMPELTTLCLSWGCEENYFSTAFNWPVFRYYYQRCIIRGNEFKDEGLEFNSYEYNKKIIKNRTSLQPMEFKSSGIKFYVADENYLDAMWKAKMNADTGRSTKKPLTDNDKKTANDFASLTDKILEAANDAKIKKMLEQSNPKNIQSILKEFSARITGSMNDIKISNFKYDIKDDDKKNIRTASMSFELSEGIFDSGNSKQLEEFQKACAMNMGVSNKEFLDDKKITLIFTSKKKDDNEYGPYELDTNTDIMKFLAFCYQRKKQEDTLGNLSDSQTENGWYINGSVASLTNMKFTDYPTGSLSILNIGALLSNQISNIHLIEVDGNSPQYMGGQDISIQMEIATTDKKTVQALISLPKYATRQLKKYRQIMPSYPVRLDSEITRFLGITDVIIDDVNIATVPNIPGTYHITLSMRSMDRTLRQRESMAMLDAQNNSDDAYSDEQGIITTKSYFEIERTIARAELYPDLELPTIEEMDLAGWKFTRYKFQDERIYTDPDFYMLYFTRLMSQMIRESILKSIDNGVGTGYEMSDNTGANVEVAAAPFNGFDVVNRNAEAQSQHEKIKQMKEAQKKLNTKELKENLTKDNEKSKSPTIASWDICKDIKCIYLEDNYKKEYDSYVARLKSNAVNNGTYSPEKSSDYDMNQQSEINKILPTEDKEQSDTKDTTKDDKTPKTYADKADENLKTDEKVAEGKWVASKLSNARQASQKIADYLSKNPINEDLKLGEDEIPIPISERKNKSNPDSDKSNDTYDKQKQGINKAIEEFLADENIIEIFKLIPIESSDSFKQVFSDIIYGAACAATGEKEYSAKKKSNNWKPSITYIGTKAGGNQDTSINNDISNIDDGVKKAIEFGIFKIKMYDANTFQNIVGRPSPPEISDQVKIDNPINTSYFLLDPYYRLTCDADIEKIKDYKKNCMSSPQYCTMAFLRIMLYWIMRMFDRQIYPSFLSDVLRNVSDAEIDTIDKAKQENVADEKMMNMKSVINLYKNNAYAIDSGKIWTASLYALTDGNSSIDNRIQKRNYSALNSYIAGCSVPTRNVRPDDTVTMVTRKMTLALVGLDRIEEISAAGIKQDSNVAKAARRLMQQKYIEMAEDPTKYTIHSCHDMIVHDARGRMLRAFPTYYMSIIDEGRTIGSYKMHDNFYNSMAISEIEIVKSRKLPADTAHITMSNVYMTFTNENEDLYEPGTLQESNGTLSNTISNISNTFSSIFTPATFAEDELEPARRNKGVETKILLRPGSRLHLRMGYGSNASMIPVVFNGSIAEMNVQESVEIIAQGDGIELVNPIMEDMKAHDIENNDDFFNMSTFENGASPKDIMTALLTTNGGWWATLLKDVVGRPDLLGRNPYGIYHFGNPDFKSIFANGETTQNIYESEGAPHITFDIFGKSVWDIANICKSVTPDHICAIAPFGFRSTLFIGAPRYYYAYDYTMNNGVILEKRKPYQQYHFYYSRTDIIGDGITATSRDMKTNAIGLYNVCASGNSVEQHRVGPLYADIDIFPECQKSMIVDTQLLGKGVPIIGTITNAINSFECIDSLYDDEGSVVSNEKIAWKMTASALRESMMDMYAGDIIVIGDPTVKPHDRMRISDSYESIDGQCLVKEVVHRMSAESGFTTAVTPDCIVTVDDKFESSVSCWYSAVTSMVLPSLLTHGYLNIAKKLGATWGLKKSWQIFMPKCIREVLSDSKIGKYASEALNKVDSKFASTAGKKAAETALSTTVGKGLLRTAMKTGLKYGTRLLFGISGPIGWAVYAAFYVGTELVTNAIERFTKNLEVTHVYPLKHFGKVWTAGLEGSKGMISGSPTEKQQGMMSDFIATVMGKGEDTGFFSGIIKDMIFGDDLTETAGRLQRNSDGDMQVSEDNTTETDNGQKIDYSFDSVLKGYNNNGNLTTNVKNDYRKLQVTPRVDNESGPELSNAYEHYAIKNAKNYQDSPKLQNNKYIGDNERLKPYIKEGFLKIIHENPGLNTGSYVDSQIIKLDGEEKYIKVIYQKQKNGSIAYDMPLLNPDAINILYEIIRRTKNAMPSANSSDSHETYEENKNSFVLLESALRAGDTESYASTGFTFILRGVEKAAKPLATAIAELYNEIKEDAAENPMLNATIFDSLDLGENKTAISVRMPKVSAEK